MNTHNKMVILFAVLALGLLMMLGDTIASNMLDFESSAPAPTLQPTAAKSTANQVVLEPAVIVIVVTATPMPIPTQPPAAAIAAPDFKPQIQAQPQTKQTGCIERWDRAAIGAPTTYGRQQALADGLVYSYGLYGDGTLENPYEVMVYTNCLELTR